MASLADNICQVHEATFSTTVTAAEYEAFHARSCVRSNFNAQYYALGAMEESAEVFEAVRNVKAKGADATAADAAAAVKEVGDALWYCTGLCRASGLELAVIVGVDLGLADAAAASSPEAESEVALVLQVGHLAGRLKKYKRGDYGEAQLQQYMAALLPGVFAALAGVCRAQGGVTLADAAAANVAKISKRLAQKTVRGDGSNREEGGAQQKS